MRPESVEYVGKNVFGETSYTALQIKVYCGAESQPENWDEEWCKETFGTVQVFWGVSEDEFDAIVTEAGYGQYL